MVVTVPMVPHAKFRPKDHREDASHFTIYETCTNVYEPVLTAFSMLMTGVGDEKCFHRTIFYVVQ